jgi:hypothetical protein
MSIFRYVLVKTGLSERRKQGRVPSRGLDVSYWTGREEKHVKVKDISATGIYLLTEDRWLPGTPVQLTLQKRGMLNWDSRLQARLRAWCVRAGDDGVGLTFIEDPALTDNWARSMDLASSLNPGIHPVRLFRTTKAIAFLLRICPSIEESFISLLARISCGRAEHVIEIILQGAELFAATEHRDQPYVAPNLLLRILEDGSKAEEEHVRNGWAGLLASTCLQPTQDSMLLFIALLSKLDCDHVAILSTGCAWAMRVGWEPEFVFPSGCHRSADEIRRITGIRNLVAIEGNLNHLHLLGLLEKTVKPLGCAQLEQVNITPTALGLKLYVRMSGRTELPEALDHSALEMAS